MDKRFSCISESYLNSKIKDFKVETKITSKKITSLRFDRTNKINQ